MVERMVKSGWGLLAVALFFGLLGASLVVSVPSSAQMDSRHVMNLQGRLTDAGGALVTGARSFRIRIFNAAAQGVVLFDETHSAVEVENGIYNILVGTGDITLGAAENGKGLDKTIFELNAELWMQLTINGADLQPRTKMVSSGFSFRAQMADAFGGGGAATGKSVGCYVHWGWDRNTNDNDGNARCGQGYYPAYTGYGLSTAYESGRQITEMWCHNKDSYPDASGGNPWNPILTYANDWGNWSAHGSQRNWRVACVVCCGENQ